MKVILLVEIRRRINKDDRLVVGERGLRGPADLEVSFVMTMSIFPLPGCLSLPTPPPTVGSALGKYGEA